MYVECKGVSGYPLARIMMPHQMNSLLSLSTYRLACQRGERRLFSGLDLALKAGQLMLVTGGNGRGKTSLLRLLAGLGEPAEGEVRWGGESILRVRESYHEALCYLAHANGVKDDLTPLENVRLNAGIRGITLNEADAAAVLTRFGLEACLDLPARVLSFGQRRRVALASLRVSAAPLWILDEPLTGLDVHGVAEVEALLREHVQGGGMVVMTTHQLLALDGIETVPVHIGPPLVKGENDGEES